MSKTYYDDPATESKDRWAAITHHCLPVIMRHSPVRGWEGKCQTTIPKGLAERLICCCFGILLFNADLLCVFKSSPALLIQCLGRCCSNLDKCYRIYDPTLSLAVVGHNNPSRNFVDRYYWIVIYLLRLFSNKIAIKSILFPSQEWIGRCTMWNTITVKCASKLLQRETPDLDNYLKLPGARQITTRCPLSTVPLLCNRVKVH